MYSEVKNTGFLKLKKASIFKQVTRKFIIKIFSQEYLNDVL